MLSTWNNFICNISLEDESHRKFYSIDIRESAVDKAKELAPSLITTLKSHGADEESISESLSQLVESAVNYDMLSAEEQDKEMDFYNALVGDVGLAEFLSMKQEDQIKFAKKIKEKSSIN